VTQWTLIILFQTAVLTGSHNPDNAAKTATAARTAAPLHYGEAYKQSTRTGRPLLVLIGAKWCPACRRMKSAILPQLSRRNALRQVAFVTIDKDQEKKLASQLMSGRTVPQLILFTKTPTGWKRRQLTGLHTAGEVDSFVHRAIAQTAAKPGQKVPR
jgi:thioredoxin-like negative regulator of GroEL